MTKASAPSGSYCGPATPNSPFESFGLGWSDFARHYFRNHGCFLFLQVLRWFTSLSLLDHPMYSDERNRCSHRLGFPIRKSPDHRLIASSRGLSQLSTSFIASLRQGIHTHALSSLTIKSISNTKFYPRTRTFRPVRACIRCHSSYALLPLRRQDSPPSGSLQILVVSIARQIFNFQRSDFFEILHFTANLEDAENQCFRYTETITFGFFGGYGGPG